MREIIGTLFVIVFDILVICFAVWMFKDLPVWLAAILAALLASAGAVATTGVVKYWLRWKNENGKKEK